MIELIDHLRVVQRHWAAVLLAVLLGAGCSVGWLVLAPREYRASTQLLVGPTVTGSTANGSARAGQSYVEDRLPSYAELVSSIGIATDVVGALGLQIDPAAFAQQVSAFVPARTTIIEVRGTAGDARSAAALANTTADRLARAVTELETPYSGGVPRVTVTSTRPATAGVASRSPSGGSTWALGLVGGLVVGLLAATAREQADGRRAALGVRRRVPAFDVRRRVPSG